MRTGLVTGLLVAAMLVLPLAWKAQRFGTGRPRVSPHETHAFEVDGCHITIVYGRPSKKGRDIWGGLVPWGRWWMPGADEATTITTDQTLVVERLTVPAGQHTLYMWPDEKTSKLIVSNETGQFHTVYHPDRDLGRVNFTLKMLPARVEQLTFSAESRPSGGVLTLTWDDREYSVGFVVKRGAL